MAEELPTTNYIQLPSDIPNSGAGSKKEHTNTKDVEVETNGEGTPAGTYTVHEKVFNIGDPIENAQARVTEGTPSHTDPAVHVRQTGLSAGELEIINRLDRLEHFAERICGAVEEWLGAHSTINF
jgi:hypothetical protein